jgi:beta-lactamase regulating signal transducer with metallopeptidase domain
MHEHVARALYYVDIHLLYASIVGMAALALTSVRGASATTKYWIWVAAVFNFVLPTGALLDRLLATRLAWARPLGVIGDLAYRASAGTIAVVLASVWLLGVALMVTRLWLRLRAERRREPAAQSASGRVPQQPSFHGIPVRFTDRPWAPSVDGVLRPSISLPDGIDRVLSAAELEAVLLHELTHARRRDNLIRLLFEAELCILWFHPLVWLAGSRLALYRELSCDESVVRRSRGPSLVAALAKLADPREPRLLRAGASTLLSHRLARLAARPQPTGGAVSAMLTVIFGMALAWGVVATMAHTACCFLVRR